MITLQSLVAVQTSHIAHCEAIIALLSKAQGQKATIGEFRRQIEMAHKAIAVIGSA